MQRRAFLTVSGTGALAALGDPGFLGSLPNVSAADAVLPVNRVQFAPEIEPLVRLIEDTPAERVIEEIASRIKRGVSYRDIVAALMLAGVRSVQPRPVGFKFHAVLVVNSAHLASLASPDSDRWLPILWAIDQFKKSQAANVKEGNWTMAPIDEAAVPTSPRAKQMFIDAMDNWDESAADAAVVGLARTAGADELFDLFARYGCRDFRDIGHKAIYVANSFRTLEVIGWHHAEPVLRSLAYALLDRSGAPDNPAKADYPADRPFRDNDRLVKKVGAAWLDGKPSSNAAKEILDAIRSGGPADTSAAAVKWLHSGAAPQSIFAALFNGAGELLMQAPGILSLHAMTFTNAIHYAWHRAQSDELRKLLLLQNAAFLPLYRSDKGDKNLRIDALEPLAPAANGAEAVVEIFEDVSKDRLMAARKMLAYLEREDADTGAIAAAARRLIFLKGNNSHDYKFSSAVLEDYGWLAAPWQNRLLASSVFYLRGSGEPDNALVQRSRAAMGV